MTRMNLEDSMLLLAQAKFLMHLAALCSKYTPHFVVVSRKIAIFCALWISSRKSQDNKAGDNPFVVFDKVALF